MPIPYASLDEQERRRRAEELAAGTPTATTGPPGQGVRLEQEPTPTSTATPPPNFTLPEGVTMEEAQDFVSRNPGDWHRVAEALKKPTSERQYDSQSVAGNKLYGSGSGNRTNVPGGPMQSPSNVPAFQNTSPQFDDPSQRLIEDYALDRFRTLQNPDPNSGTGLFEKYARELIDTLRGPVYSASDEAIIKTKALDTIMGEQDRTLQQWMEQLSRRGIPPSSGPALEGIRQIQEHYKTLRTQVEADFARDAISQTRAQRTQVLDTAGQLAGSENTRLNAAGTYAAMPYGLSQDAFQRGLQLVGAGGNPASLVQSLLSVANAGQQADYYDSQRRQQLTSGLMQLIAYAIT